MLNGSQGFAGEAAASFTYLRELTGVTAVHFGIVAVVLLSAYALGRRLLRRIHFANQWEACAFSTGLGLGILAQAIFLLGLVGLIHPATTILTLLLCLGVGWRDLRAGARRLWARLRDASAFRWIMISVSALVIVFFAIHPLYPPHRWDALSYHLPSARIFAESHAILPTPFLRFCAFPQLNEMLYTAAFTLSDAITAQVIQFALTILTGVAIAGAAARLSTAAVLPATAAWLGIPLVLILGSQAYIDVGLAFFCMLFLNSVSNWKEDGLPAWALLAGIFGGFAAATKYTALFLVGCFGLFLIAHAARKRSVRLVLQFSIAVAAVAGPWYAWVYAVTGNPVFPFLSGVFGTGCWDARDVAHVTGELFERLGTGRSPGSLLMLPWNLAFEPDKFHVEGTLSIALFAGLPVWLFVGFLHRRTQLLSALSFAFILFWFYTAQVPRYLFPVLPTLCLLLGHTIAIAADRLPRGRSLIVTILGVALVYPSVRFTLERIRVLGPPPVTAESTDQFFRRFPTYDCYEWVNDHYPDDYVMYAFDAPYMAYFASGTRIGDILGPGRYPDFRRTTGQELKSALEGVGASLVLFSTNADWHYPPPDDISFERHFRPVTSCSGGSVWRVSPVERVRIAGEERLLNGGFEASLQGWDVSAGVTLDMSGRFSSRGKGAVLIQPGLIPLMQTIAIEPNQSYSVRFQTRAAAVPSGIRFVLTWFDSDRARLRDDVHLSNSRPEWSTEAFVVTSPSRAATVAIYPEGVTNPIWYDEISIRAVRYGSGNGETSDMEVAEARTILGVFRPATRQLFVRRKVAPGFADSVFRSEADGLPLAGDWDANGSLEPALYDPSTGQVRIFGGRTPDLRALPPGIHPLAGDWNGDGMTGLGYFDPSTGQFVIDEGADALRFQFGEPGDVPLSGDWNGDGTTTIGVYRPSTRTFYLRNRNAEGAPDLAIATGDRDGIPIAGDWNSDGIDSPGLYDQETGVFMLWDDEGLPMIIRLGVKGDRPFAGSL